jgi:hypothetical protein
MHSSFDSSVTSSFGEDVSEETHKLDSSASDESVPYSSESDEPENDQPIRVYDARFKIPA